MWPVIPGFEALPEFSDTPRKWACDWRMHLEWLVSSYHLIKPYAGAGGDVQQQHSSTVLHQLVRPLWGHLHSNHCQLLQGPICLIRLRMNSNSVCKALATWRVGDIRICDCKWAAPIQFNPPGSIVRAFEPNWKSEPAGS